MEHPGSGDSVAGDSTKIVPADTGERSSHDSMSEIRHIVGQSVGSPSYRALSQRSAGTGTEAIRRDDSKLIAFYLPQFHVIPENSEWWGAAFTEWTNVARGRPNFEGHVQPKIPGELGYYDLSEVDVMARQAALARTYGLHGFCFYHYWFGGRRILEKPVDQFLKSDIDFNFCLCWANENWTRTWDGKEQDVLLHQRYAEGDALAFIRDLMPYIRDPRYIRVNGAPLVMVYRAKAIPDAAAWFRIWKNYAAEHGIPDLHICVVDFYDIKTAKQVGADALVEFPPHKFNGPETRPSRPLKMTNSEFKGGVLDYARIVARSANRPESNERLYRGVMPGWDNTARRQNTPTIVIKSSPRKYEEWLRFLRVQAAVDHTDADHRLIFLNAWNEWGEGCYLEPDQQFGLGYLESTLRSSVFDRGRGEIMVEQARQRLFDFLDITEVAGEGMERNLQFMPDPAVARRRRRSSAEETSKTDKIDWSRIQPPSRLVTLVATQLSRWPFAHRVAAKAYSVLRALLHR